MIVPAVAGRVAVGPVAPVEAARCAQRAQSAVAKSLVEIGAGEIHEDVLAPERVIPERAVPRNPRVRVDDLQARESSAAISATCLRASRA